jgi:multicomponent K+:H+ antiporter subunit D
MMSHLVIAPVLLPALFAGMLALLRPPVALQRLMSLAATVLLLAIAVNLLRDAATGVQQVYLLGNWPAPFGIALVLDRLSALMLVLTALLALPVLIAAMGGEDRRGPHFHALLQFQLMGLNGAFLTGDLFNLFVFFEVLLIASYCLLLHGGGAGRVRAGLHYVVINLVGSALFLIAAAMLYSVTGTLNLADLAVKVAALGPADRVGAHAAALILLVVFGLKAALFPLFLWLPPAYTNASAPVAALFAIMTKVGVYAILRVYLLVFGPQAETAAPHLELWLLPAALATMGCGALAALASRRLAGIAAQLTLVSVGTALLGAALATPQAVSATLYYVAHSTFAGALLFLVCGLVAAQRGSTGDALRQGVALPHVQLSALLFLLAGVAVAGMPPLSGFLGKAMLLQASSTARAAPWIWLVILATSFFAILALVRAGLVVFWSPRAGSAAGARINAAGFASAMLVLLAVLVLAAAAEPVKQFTDATAAQLADSGSYIAAVLGTRERP